MVAQSTMRTHHCDCQHAVPSTFTEYAARKLHHMVWQGRIAPDKFEHTMTKLSTWANGVTQRMNTAMEGALRSGRDFRNNMNYWNPYFRQPQARRDDSVQIYDSKNTDALPGERVDVREHLGSDGYIWGSNVDAAVKEAYNGAKGLLDFLKEKFGRNSIDGQGMPLIMSVHYLVDYFNAFWNGEQMAFGDGNGPGDDGIRNRFTRDVDILMHEAVHGITEKTLGLVYEGEPGALNEHLSDVFGLMYKQHRMAITVPKNAPKEAWLIGDKVIPDLTGNEKQSMRSFANVGDASEFDMQELALFRGRPHVYAMRVNAYDPIVQQDHGGVHIFSGILNSVFYEVAKDLQEPLWENLGQVWYDVMTHERNPHMTFQQFAERTVYWASRRNLTDLRHRLVNAWRGVGIEPVRVMWYRYQQPQFFVPYQPVRV